MRSGLSIVHHTLTPEAANIMDQSIVEAGRHTHGQTTPLHVAATLLASPSAFLRQACIRSHPNWRHPLQCRALELCFSVALERLPTAQDMAPGMEPPLSNALMAALKRAQAYQRRGCPEQQQQPLLAVKVELDQLIISILDDPSVSRVMREASFSSPAVKTAIEQLMNSSNSHGHQQHPHVGPTMASNSGQLMQSPSPIVPLVSPNPYLNSRSHWGSTAKIPDQMSDEVKKVVEIMARGRKRNPILVGNSEAEAVVKELLRKIENQELVSDVILKHATVISMEKGVTAAKMKELQEMIESRIINGGVVIHLGDLEWLMDLPLAADTGRTVVAEMSRLLARFRRDGSVENKLWLIGTARCETYLRCQVYYSCIENDWDIQAVPIAQRSPLPRNFPRLEIGGLFSNPEEPASTSARPVPTAAPENFERTKCCPQCCENYVKEVAKLEAIHKSFTEASLPQWLQNAKLNVIDHSPVKGSLPEQKTRELQKKWKDICMHNHSHYHRSSPPTPTLHTQNLLPRSVFQPNLHKLKKTLGELLRLDTSQSANSPPASPVRTDLTLGRRGPEEEEEEEEDRAKDFLGCFSSEQAKTSLVDKCSNALDADSYKKLLKGLMEKAWWQGEAASAVASAITRCRLGNGKLRGDVWLLFRGPDRVGKKKMAMVIAEQVCGDSPVIICLGTRRGDEESDTNIRGKTAIDRIAEAVQRNPFSVIMLQDVDEANVIALGNIKQAAERGRITDSRGREVGLGNAIFIVTGNWSTIVNDDASSDCHFVDENWELGLLVREKTRKRHGSWFDDDDRRLRQRGLGLSLDLNLATSEVEDGSHNSSVLTIDNDDEFSHVYRPFAHTSVPPDVLSNVDDSIVFNPVDTACIRREIKKTISLKFSTMDDNVSLEVEDEVVEKVLGGLLHDRTSLGEWIEKVLEPLINQVKTLLAPGARRNGLVARLVVKPDPGCQGRSNGRRDWLPRRILV